MLFQSIKSSISTVSQHSSQHSTHLLTRFMSISPTSAQFTTRTTNRSAMHLPSANVRLCALPEQEKPSKELRSLLDLSAQQLLVDIQTVGQSQSSALEKKQAWQSIEKTGQFLVQEIQKAVPGIAIGSPLALLAAIFTGLHYGENVVGLKDIYIQTLIGYFTYGFDRLLDAIQADAVPTDGDYKQDRYDAILNNKTAVIATLTASSALALRELAAQPETLPFIPLLLSTLAYKELKEHAGVVKPFYVATMWTLCSVALPCVMHDKNWNILQSPQHLLPITLLIFGLSNLLDVKDIQEDSVNSIETLPVKIGKWPAVVLATSSIGVSLALIAQQTATLYTK